MMRTNWILLVGSLSVLGLAGCGDHQEAEEEMAIETPQVDKTQRPIDRTSREHVRQEERAIAAARVQRAQENRDRVTAVEEAVAAIEKLGAYIVFEKKDLRPQSWLEEQFDDPGGVDDPIGVLKVTEVNIWAKNITDTDLEFLKELPDLEALNLYSTEVTDAGLEHLKGLTGLQELHLHDTKVTDAGLVHLKGLTKLRWLSLFGTKVTEEGVKKLQQVLPNCEITYTKSR